jgi:hypothetical protein
MSHGRTFNPKVSARKTDTVTYEGADAYTYEDARNELIAAVATTFLDDKFYETAEDRMDRVRKLIKEVAEDQHYRFLWNLVRYTRDEWHLRSISHLLAGEYLLIPELRTFMDYRDGFTNCIPADILADKVFIRPDDVAKVFGYWMQHNPYKANTKRKMPRLLRRAVQIWFNKLTRFKASKYQARLAGKQITLKRLLKMTHPKPTDKAQEQLFKEILEETIVGDANWTKEITSEQVNEEGETISTKEKWEKAIPKMAYMPLVSNLAAFDRAGVDPKLVLPKLTDPKAVANSRLLPFRFITAIEHVDNMQYKEALKDAFIYSFANVNLPEGNYLIAVDQSTSMTMNKAMGSNARDCMQDAAIFGSIVHYNVKKPYRADLVMFGSELKQHDVFDMGIVGITQYLRQAASGGATNGYLIWEFYEKQKAKGIKYDYIFIMTDMQFTSVNKGYGAGILIGYSTSAYQGKPDPVPPRDVLIINMDLQGYESTLTPFQGGSNVAQISGFSDKVFQYLEVVKNPSGLIQKIENS